MQPSIEPTMSMSAKNHWQTWADTAELADMARLDSQPPQRHDRRAQVGQKILLADTADRAASPKPVVFHPPQPAASDVSPSAQAVARRITPNFQAPR
ncbi:MAG: hypothetical protein C0485_08770 [Pirellula sp.]|nr:hypothetical protein [Pirellula sp.]